MVAAIAVIIGFSSSLTTIFGGGSGVPSASAAVFVFLPSESGEALSTLPSASPDGMGADASADGTREGEAFSQRYFNAIRTAEGVIPYRATTRMLATMAEDNIISEHLSNTNISIMAIMVVCIVISFFGSHMLEDFTELTFLGAVICFGYTSASAWKLAKEKGNRMYVITGVIGIVVSAVFAIVKLVPWLPSVNPMGANAFLLLTVWCLLGFMFHLRTLARSSAGVYSGSSLSGIMMFALLLFSVLMWLGKRLLEADSIDMVKRILRYEGGLMLIVIFIGLGIMLYIQKLTQKKHEELLKETAHHLTDDGK